MKGKKGRGREEREVRKEMREREQWKR